MATPRSYEVASLDEANATRVKNENARKDFDTFMYDNETSPGAIQIFEDVRKKCSDVSAKIDEMEQNYKELKDKYETFTNFNDTMDTYIKNARSSIDLANRHTDKLIGIALEKVQAAAEQDKTLLDDVEALKDLLGMESDEGVGGVFKGA